MRTASNKSIYGPNVSNHLGDLFRIRGCVCLVACCVGRLVAHHGLPFCCSPGHVLSFLLRRPAGGASWLAVLLLTGSCVVVLAQEAGWWRPDASQMFPRCLNATRGSQQQKAPNSSHGNPIEKINFFNNKNLQFEAPGLQGHFCKLSWFAVLLLTGSCVVVLAQEAGWWRPDASQMLPRCLNAPRGSQQQKAPNSSHGNPIEKIIFV
jgi:hypothetical protein